MRKIKVSEEVWNEIATRGKFGETEDDVLRRVFNLKPRLGTEEATANWIKRAGGRMVHRIEGKVFRVGWPGGPLQEWKLPNREEKQLIRNITMEAMRFAEEIGGTRGQVNAVRKELTEAGYHITK